MFIFDFVAETILDQILDWIYGKIIGFLNDFFVMMNNMGVELFELPWVNAVTTFFSYLGWALFGVGLVVGAFECAMKKRIQIPKTLQIQQKIHQQEMEKHWLYIIQLQEIQKMLLKR